MDKHKLKFITNIYKPFDDLNKKLSNQNAAQPDINDLILEATNLANQIKHFCDHDLINQDGNDRKMKEYRKIIDNDSNANKIMSDISDLSKHGTLRDTNRIHNLNLSSAFEYNDEGMCSFLRNIIRVRYENGFEYDFIRLAGEAINYWIIKNNYDFELKKGEMIADRKFENVACLYYDAKATVYMESVRIETLKKDDLGELINFNPDNVMFALFEK
jgi:hypothetical protein